jgi:hypothetical protein
MRVGSSIGIWNSALQPPAAVTNGGYGPSNTIEDGSSANTDVPDQGQYEFFGCSELSDLRAWYWVDLAPDGYLSEAVGTMGYPNFDLQYTATGAVDVKVFPWSLYPSPGK